MKRVVKFVLIVLIAVALSACEGGGGASMTRQACNTTNVLMQQGSVSCTGGARSVRGTYSFRSGSDLLTGTYDVTAAFSAEEGFARIIWLQSEGELEVGVLSAGEPLEYSGPVEARSGSLAFRVEVQGDSLSGFDYSVEGTRQ